MKRCAPTIATLLILGCSDSPGEKSRLDAGFETGTDASDASMDEIAPSDTAPNNSASDFVVRRLRAGGAEQGERVVTFATATGTACEAGAPTMILAPAIGEPQTVTAVACDENRFDLDFAPSVPPGTYEPQFINANGVAATHEERIEFVVYEKLGLDQAPLGPGLSPDLAVTPGAAAAVIVGIDPSDEQVFVLARSRDFAVDGGRIPTGVTARTVTVGEKERENTVSYALFWADDSSVGVLWLDEDGTPTGTTPPPLPANQPEDLDVATDESGTWAVAWREPDGALQVAITDESGAGWTLGATPIASGEWPTLVTSPPGFRLYWHVAPGEEHFRAFDVGGPGGDEQVVDSFWARCDYGRTGAHRVCEHFQLDPPFVAVLNGSEYYTMHDALVPQPHPGRAESDPARAASPDSTFVSYIDRFGGTSYELFERKNGSFADDPRRVVGRIAQPFEDGKRPQLSVSGTSDGEGVLAWVVERDGQIELGTIRFDTIP